MMKMSRFPLALFTSAALSLALLGAAPAFAHGSGGDDQNQSSRHHHRDLSPEQRQARAKARLDREAKQLEITASQQAAWDGFAAARLDLMTAFVPAQKPAAPADFDAAQAARRHADRAAEIAKKLSTLADATEKLEAVLTPDQRKVLNRMAQRHGHPHRRHR